MTKEEQILIYVMIWGLLVAVTLFFLIRKANKQCDHKNTFTYTNETHVKVTCLDCKERIKKEKL